jgi:hypothetical protein
MLARRIAIVLFAFFLLGCSELPDPPIKPHLEPKTEKLASGVFSSPKKYAVLISGITEIRHRKNLSLVYKTLIDYGFKRDNIYILDYWGKQRSDYMVDGGATKKNTESVFTHLRKRIGGRDFLFVFTTDHGGKSKRTFEINGRTERMLVSTLSFPGHEKDIDEIELASYINGLKFRTGVFLFAQCFSGGFAERTAGKNRITISASEKNKGSYGASFSNVFFGAFCNRVADADSDGAISIREAFRYALKNDRYTVKGKQKPQMFYGVEGEVFLK